MAITAQTLIACGWCGLVLATAAQSPGQSVRPVSINDCIQMALQHNLDIQIERCGPEIGRFVLENSYGAYDPLLRFTARETFASVPRLVDPQKQNVDYPYEETIDTYAPGLTGRTPWGLSYGLGASWDSSRLVSFLPISFDFPTGRRDTNQYQSTVVLTLRQPLLKNFWTDADRYRISLNKKNLKISELALQQQIINVVTQVELAYYDLLYTRELINVQRKALELAQQVLEENRQRQAAEKVGLLEVQQAEAQVETAQANLIAARQADLEQQNALKALLSDDYRSWPDVRLEPTEKPLLASSVFNRQESWQTAMDSRLDLRQFRLELEKKDLAIRYYFNQLFPALDLVGSYAHDAGGLSYGDVWQQLGKGSHPAYSYGVVISVPLTRKAERSNYRAAQAAQKQSQLQLKKLEEAILIQVDNAGRTVEMASQQARAARRAREYAEAALAGEQKRLEVGGSTTFVVLQLQRNLTEARLAEIRALADYNKALVQLAFGEGSTLERHHIGVEVK